MIRITLEEVKEFEKKAKYYEYHIKECTRALVKEYKSTTIDSVSGSTKTIPYSKMTMKIEGRDEVRIRNINKRKKSFQKRKEKIYKEFKYKIDRLSEEDTVIAAIIEKRVIDRKEFKDIAMELGYAGESGVRNAYNRYFLKNN